MMPTVEYTTGTLLDMMTYQRRARSKGESLFLARYLDGIGTPDGYGNLRVEVDPDRTSTLFSCHVDSVHPTTGERQKVCVDEALGQAFKDDRHTLGADDAVGVWLMLHMIQSGVPGVYVFHRDEEIGGQGSNWIATHDAAFLRRFNRAIAFDRGSMDEVITHQMGFRCASDGFADALSSALGRGFRPSAEGVFTDTANYDGDIPECTNIGVGYLHEHTKYETLDLRHAEYLRDVVVSVDWEALPTLRDPEAWDAARDGWPSDDPYGALGHDYAQVITFRNEDEALDYVMNQPGDAAALLYMAYGGS